MTKIDVDTLRRWLANPDVPDNGAWVRDIGSQKSRGQIAATVRMAVTRFAPQDAVWVVAGLGEGAVALAVAGNVLLVAQVIDGPQSAAWFRLIPITPNTVALSASHTAVGHDPDFIQLMTEWTLRLREVSTGSWETVKFLSDTGTLVTDNEEPFARAVAEALGWTFPESEETEETPA